MRFSRRKFLKSLASGLFLPASGIAQQFAGKYHNPLSGVVGTSAAASVSVNNGIIAYFRLDESSPTNWPDTGPQALGSLSRLQGPNNTAAAVISNGYRPINSNDGAEGSFFIDGHDSLGNSMLGASAGNSGTGSGHDYTVNFWLINMNIQGGTAHVLLSQGTTVADIGWQVYGVSGDVFLYTQGEFSPLETSQSPAAHISTNATFHMITCGWDHTRFTKGAPWIMIDAGSYAETDAHASGNDFGTIHGSANFCIGATTALTLGAGNLVGIIDEVGMWDRKLTAAEITYLYNAGSGNRPSSV